MRGPWLRLYWNPFPKNIFLLIWKWNENRKKSCKISIIFTKKYWCRRIHNFKLRQFVKYSENDDTQNISSKHAFGKKFLTEILHKLQDEFLKGIFRKKNVTYLTSQTLERRLHSTRFMDVRLQSRTLPRVRKSSPTWWTHPDRHASRLLVPYRSDCPREQFYSGYYPTTWCRDAPTVISFRGVDDGWFSKQLMYLVVHSPSPRPVFHLQSSVDGTQHLPLDNSKDALVLCTNSPCFVPIKNYQFNQPLVEHSVWRRHLIL